jgi:putative ABC transport system permease protein
MKIELINYAITNLFHRKTRSLLTILSVLIGIMAIYTLVSFGLGIQRYVDTLAQDAGVDKIFIQAKGMGAPGTDSTFYLSRDDFNFVKKIKGVAFVSALYAKPAKIEFKKETRYTYLLGTDPKQNDFIQNSLGIEIEKGRSLKKGETNKAALGYNYLFDDKVFSRKLVLGDKILINGREFEIVSFVSEVGNPQDDSQIYVTEEAMEQLYPSIKDKFGFMIAQTEKGIDPQELADKITEKLRKHKNQEEGKEDFYAQTFADAIATFSIIINIINSVLFLIALVSLIVASVNIMNTMYTAVLERTQEIGIMKAIGAKNSDILKIFIFESGALGMMGGIVGVIFGYFVASLGGLIAKSAGYALLTPIFPWQLSAACILFSFAIGAIAGLFPARQASRLKPVEALRYE